MVFWRGGRAGANMVLQCYGISGREDGVMALAGAKMVLWRWRTRTKSFVMELRSFVMKLADSSFCHGVGGSKYDFWHGFGLGVGRRKYDFWHGVGWRWRTQAWACSWRGIGGANMLLV
ncbi:hypothetical protein SDJN03_23050, partial [Cucurbita argyrosperma subsp. sororia]